MTEGEHSDPELQGTEGEALLAEDPVDTLGPQIRELRQQRGLTLTRLAAATGLSVGHLSQVERGLSTPTIRQLQLISSAMGVTIGWFFRMQEPRDEEDSVVVRAGRRKVLQMGRLGLTDELLVPNLDGQLELLLCTIQPGAGSPDSYTHDGEEAGFILSGALELWVDEKFYTLGAGDSFALASTRPHRYRNPGPDETRVIWAITPPSF